MVEEQRRAEAPRVVGAPRVVDEGGRDPQAAEREHNRGLGELPAAPSAPGGGSSPQKPGQAPNRSTIPGQYRVRVPRVEHPTRPLTEAGTAQEIMGVYAAKPGAEMDPARFEQATASYEELRKAYPAQLPPGRPRPGYALETGDAIAGEQQAIGGAMPAAALPSSAVGEPAGARPGGGTAELGGPVRTDAAAAVGGALDPGDASASVRSAADAVRDPMDGGEAGMSRWAEAAPVPGEMRSPGGALSAADGGAAGASAASTEPAASRRPGGWRRVIGRRRG